MRRLAVPGLLLLSLLGRVHAEETVEPAKLPTYEAAGRMQGHTALVRALAFRPDTHELVSGGSDRSLRRWDVDTGKMLVKHVLPRAG